MLCLSHLRWNFVFQRPQHLMVRWARRRRVFFFEEPIRAAGSAVGLSLQVSSPAPGILVGTPHVPAGLDAAETADALRHLLDGWLAEHGCSAPVLWYYTPMALAFSRHLTARAVVYDCMDELSAFAGAPPELGAREAELLARADLVFTGGHSLYEAKRGQHRRMYPFPSSVDRAHFAKARAGLPEPADQAAIPRPRLGFFGVIDERMDLGLLDGLAAARPDWQVVMLGPVVKIDPASLPRRPNLHYLGMKSYAALPEYLAGWDVALLPFARNESTRYISPTKTPEYLAAGRPVVSTSITDVVRPYGHSGLVQIADTAPAFVAAVESALLAPTEAWLGAVDAMLSLTSWDQTFAQMRALVEDVARARPRQRAAEPGLLPAAEGV